MRLNAAAAHHHAPPDPPQARRPARAPAAGLRRREAGAPRPLELVMSGHEPVLAPELVSELGLAG